MKRVIQNLRIVLSGNGRDHERICSVRIKSIRLVKMAVMEKIGAIRQKVDIGRGAVQLMDAIRSKITQDMFMALCEAPAGSLDLNNNG